MIAARGILRLRDDGSGYIVLGVTGARLPSGDYAVRLILPEGTDLFGSSSVVGDLHSLAKPVMPGSTADGILTSNWRPKKSDVPKLINRWGAQRIPPFVLEDDETEGGT